jgi:hypothetical protein
MLLSPIEKSALHRRRRGRPSTSRTIPSKGEWQVHELHRPPLELHLACATRDHLSLGRLSMSHPAPSQGDWHVS